MHAPRSTTPAPVSLRPWIPALALALAAGCDGGGGSDGGPVAPLGDWLPAFGALPGLDGTVNTSAVYDSGDGPVLYLGGDFFGAGAADGSGPGIESMGLIGWDGTRWRSTGDLGGPLSALGYLGGVVDSLAVFDDGSGPALYVGGDFELSYEDALDAFETANLARFDGSTWAPVGEAPNGPVSALVVHNDGTGDALYAGGSFTQIGGQNAARIARWDGIQWSQVGGGANGPVQALAVHEDTTDASGVALYMAEFPRVRRFDGTNWIDLPGTFDAPVLSLTSYPDVFVPSLIAGGSFQSVNFDPVGSVAANRVIRYRGAEGWSALGTGTDDVVAHVQTIDSGGQVNLWAAGGFESAGGESSDGVARWDGFDWIGLGSGPVGTVRTLAVYPAASGGVTLPRVHAGGNFTQIGQQQAARVAFYNGEGWSPLTGGADGAVRTVLVDGPGLYVGGSFAVVGGVAVDGIAHWDGAIWSDLDGGLVSAPNGINALALFDEGAGPRLFAGGTAGIDRLWRYDGNGWSPAGPDFIVPGSIEALEVHDDGAGPDLYVGGGFDLPGGISYIARWDGQQFSSLGNGPNSTVRALASFDFGTGPELVIGGFFTSVGGAPMSRVAAYDGATWRPLGSGFDAVVLAFAVLGGDQSQGSVEPVLYAAGEFFNAGGQPARSVARWNGDDWEPLGEGLDGRVEALTVFDDGNGPRLYAGGSFQRAPVGGQPLIQDVGVARWSGGEWQALSFEPDGEFEDFEVRALAAYADGGAPRLLVGGTFAEGPSGDSFLAQWGEPIEPSQSSAAAASALSNGEGQ